MACSLLFYPKKKPSPFFTYVQWNRWAKDQGLGERYLPVSVRFFSSENKSLSQPVWNFYRASAGKEKKKEYERGFLLVHVQSQTL